MPAAQLNQPATVNIQPLAHFTLADLRRLIRGYTTYGRYEVAYVTTTTETTFHIRLQTLAQLHHIQLAARN